MKWRLDAGQIEVIDEDMAAIYRAKSPSERVAIACQAHRTARLVLTARIHSLHPDWSEAEVNREASRRLLSGAG